MKNDDDQARPNGRFRPGESGNPSGRPKGSRNRATLARVALRRKVTVVERGQRKRITVEELGFRNLADKAAAGDIKAFAYLHAIATDAHDEHPERTSALDQEIIRQALERLAQRKEPKS